MSQNHSSSLFPFLFQVSRITFLILLFHLLFIFISILFHFPFLYYDRTHFVLVLFDLFCCLWLIQWFNFFLVFSVEGSFYVSFCKKEVGPDTPQNGLQSTILPLTICVQTLSPSLREDAAKWAYPLFLPQKERFSSFCCKRNFSLAFAAGLTFLLCSKTSCCAI